METASASFPRTAGLIARLLLRRFVNRIGARRRRSKPGARTGTGRKAAGSSMLGGAVVVIFVFNAFFLSSATMDELKVLLGPVRNAEGQVELSRDAYRRLRVYDRPAPGRMSDEHLENFFGEGTDRHDNAAPWIRVYRQRGLSGFAPAPSEGWPAWDSPEVRPVLSRTLGLILLLIAVAQYFMALGTQNQNLARVEWSTEWLFSLPASAEALFGAQIFGYALVDGLAWVVSVPFLIVVYRTTGVGWLAVPAALFNTLCICLGVASLRVSTETFLRKRFGASPVKNLQAIFSLLGIIFFFFLVGCTRSPMVLEWIVRLARTGPAWLAWNPLGAVAAFFAGNTPVVLTTELAAGVAIPLGATWYCARLVADGLITAPGGDIGTRGRLPEALPGQRQRELIPSGIVGKDVRLLLRDRTFFVQTLITPLLIVGFQIFLNPVLLSSVGKTFQGSATFAFAVGAYVLMYTGITVLSVEGNALWMLYGLPVPLHEIMLRKTLLWMSFAAAYTGIALLVCAHYAPKLEWADWSYAVAALAGVVIYAFISAGLGMLATDPMEVEVRRRVRPAIVYLYLLLAGTYGYALHAPSEWTRLGEIVLSALLAYALWQKVKDRAPYLLDPVSAPPPQVSLADGLVAALAFFVLQGLIVLALRAINSDAPLGDVLVVAFTGAGALVMAGALTSFWFRKIPDLPFVLGLNARAPQGLRGILIGVGLGIAAGIFGAVYLFALNTVPQLQELRDSVHEVQGLDVGALAILAVGAAPIFEEFIFRGLVFRGLRRSLPVFWSILASAAIFAVCHPPASVLPVFVMAVFAAWGFERTGWLVTPICVHMMYNAIVLVVNANLWRP